MVRKFEGVSDRIVHASISGVAGLLSVGGAWYRVCTSVPTRLLQQKANNIGLVPNRRHSTASHKTAVQWGADSFDLAVVQRNSWQIRRTPGGCVRCGSSMAALAMFDSWKAVLLSASRCASSVLPAVIFISTLRHHSGLCRLYCWTILLDNNE